MSNAQVPAVPTAIAARSVPRGTRRTQSNQKVIGKPVVTSHGLVAAKDDKKFAKEIEVLLETMMLNMKPEALKNHRDIENDIRSVVRKHVVRTKKRYPLIIPTIFIV